MRVDFLQALQRFLTAGALGLWALCPAIGVAEEAEPPPPLEDEAVAAEADDPAAEESMGQEPAAAQQAMEEVVVTGSRIRRNEFSSASPITIITGEQSALAGLLKTEDILQGSTIAAGQQIDDSFSGFVTDGGPGSRSVSLRGLGANRTLVLVNGKRWGPSGVRGATNSVDLTAIPSSLVNRIEILKDGASSIYGADAISGVVNLITRQRVDGFQANLQTDLPHSAGAEGYGMDFVWGTVQDTWSFNVSANFAKQENLVMNQRGYSECERRPRFTDQDGDGTLDNTHPDTGEPLCFGMIYGFSVVPFFGWSRYEPSLSGDGFNPGNSHFDSNGPSHLGVPYYTGLPEHGLDPFNNRPLFDNEGAYYRDERRPSIREMVPNAKVFSVTSFADKDFDVGGRSANTYYEFYYNRRSSKYNSGYRQFFPQVSRNNPTNPFGRYSPMAQVTAQDLLPLLARRQIPLFLAPLYAARFFNPGFNVTPVLPSYELLDPVGTVEIDRFTLIAGLKGDFSAEWSYDAYGGYSYSDGSYESQQFLDDRVAASLDATLDAGGNLVCADNSIPGCVPANLFTEDALLRGRLPADVLNFIRKDTRGTTVYKTLQFSGYATGPLFRLPNEEAVSVVFGLEWRNEDINDVPDPDAQTNNIWGTTTAGITSGDDSVTELFTELEVPLLKNQPLAEELVLNGSGRWTSYKSYGSDFTYRLALDYQTLPALRLRGTLGTSFRAPDVYEQFLANQVGFLSSTNLDPCINYGEDREPGDAVYDNCAAQGLPPDLGSQGSPSFRNIVGGNPNLKAETSDSWTAGVVIQPESLGLSLAYSWFNIDLKNTVESVSAAYVLGTCYGSAGLSSPFCDRVAPRDENGFLTSIDASVVNIGRQLNRGFDVDFLYEKEFSTFDLTIDGTITRLKEYRVQVFDTDYDNIGHWGYPEWSGALDLRIDYRDWTFFWRVRMIGDTAEDPVYDPDTTNVDRPFRTKNEWYHTPSVRYRKGDWDIIATVRNLFDNQPPVVADGVPRNETTRIFNILPGVGYDRIGRSYVLQVSRRF